MHTKYNQNAFYKKQSLADFNISRLI
uniref:Uncharacterized protein n=1 Tax=Anguilla anguilla TaxID=7936 RepID=A0A0E9PRL5_ANGAN